MLTLALIAMLDAPAPASLPRVPGMRLRLGMTESQVLATGPFAAVQDPGAGAMAVRRGPARFFGVPGEATCYLRDGVLSEVSFQAADVGRHSQEYVDGQLRVMGFSRACDRDLPGDRVCTWTGPALRVQTEVRKDGLKAHVVPWPPPPEPARDSTRVAAGPAKQSAVAGAGAAPQHTSAAGGTAAGGAAAAPQAAGAGAAAGGTSTTTLGAGAAGAAVAGGTGAGAAGGGAPAVGGAPTTGGAPAGAGAQVATLPETLTISLAALNSVSTWPRIVSSPPLDYPAAARRSSVQGVVWVFALVEPDGQVSDAWIDRGILELDPTALAWVSRCRFAPCERNGAPCRFHVRVAVRFTLH